MPLAALKAFRQRLSSLLGQAEQFRGLLGETWLPRVGAAVCAAHYLEHQLREPQGVLLLAELQDAAAAGAAGAAGGADGAAGEGAAGDAAAAAGGRGLAALVEREAAAFSALRKQWAYKLAKQAVDAFHQLFTPYKCVPPGCAWPIFAAAGQGRGCGPLCAAGLLEAPPCASHMAALLLMPDPRKPPLRLPVCPVSLQARRRHLHCRLRGRAVPGAGGGCCGGCRPTRALAAHAAGSRQPAAAAARAGAASGCRGVPVSAAWQWVQGAWCHCWHALRARVCRGSGMAAAQGVRVWAEGFQ